MKNRFLTTIAVINTLFLFGQKQIDFGIKANYGVSQNRTFLLGQANRYDKMHKYSFCPSGQVGLFLNFHLGKKSLLATELVFTQFKAHERKEIRSENDYYLNETWAECNGIGMPIYYGYKIKKFTINIGLNTMYLFNANYRDKGYWFGYSGGRSDWDFNDNNYWDGDMLGYYKRLSFSFLYAGIVYKISDKYSIEANYLSARGDWIRSDWARKVSQITIGFHYNLLQKEKHKE